MNKKHKEKNQPYKIENILSQIPVHVYWYDLNSCFQGCNELQAKTLGLKSNLDIIGQHLASFMPESEWIQIEKNNQKVLQQGHTLVFEEMHTNRHGKKKIYLSHKTPLKNKTGEIIGIVGVSHDITSIRSISTAPLTNKYLNDETSSISTSNQFPFSDNKTISTFSQYVTSIRDYYENIIAIMPGHVYWQNNQGTLLGCNDNQAHTLGLNNRKEIFGKTISSFLDEKESKTHNDTFNTVMKTKQSVILEEKSTDGKGNEKYYFTQKRPILDNDGSTLGLLGYSLDITERKKAELEVIRAREKAEIANQAKSDFLMNMSHDLRTPCSGIVGLAKILSEKENDPVKKMELQHIVKSSENLLNLLNEILDFTKVEDGAYKTLKQHFNLRKLINSIHELLAAEIEYKNLTTQIDYPNTMPDNIISDPVALHRVLLNLLGNAIKFTETGSIKTQINIDKTKSMLTISIQDTGIGIEENKLGVIFDRFSRLSPAYDGKHNGTGLGLSTVSRLLIELDGHINVTSKINLGSVFTINIPIELNKNEHHNQHQPESQAPNKELDFSINPGLSVLVVEDDFISKQVSKALFESFLAEVTWVGTANEALCCDLSQFDFILTDIGLPDMSGFELAKKIRQWEKDHRVSEPCFIVGLTAHINPSYLKKMENCGLSDLIQKPLTREHIEQF